jgi:CubicO group peptidase (beta-lactamase class C family)
MSRRTPLAALAVALVLPFSLSAQRGPVAERIRRVEAGLLPAVVVQGRADQGVRLEERMRALNVPGVSIAVINNGAIEWAKGYGVKEAGGTAPVDTATLFQAASISKPVAAMAALDLVEEGKLALDEDVNLKLKSWQMPPSALAAGKPVTLRRLLTHSGGTTVSGFRGYAASESVPTVLQVLNGAPPANSQPIIVDLEPSTRWRYSGGGYTVMQQLVEDAAGKPFPQVMRERVLDKLGMRRSTYEQPLPAARAGEAAVAHRQDGTPVPGKWHTYPEMAAAGLWTTPSDLARFAIELQRAYHGKSNRVLSAETAREMLKVHFGSHGLGPAVEGEGRALLFTHGGSNVGYKCVLVAFHETGQGAVIMTNGDQGSMLAAEIVRALAREYDWPARRSIERRVVAVESARLTPLVGEYRVETPALVVSISESGGRLFVKLPAWPSPNELLPESDSSFFIVERGGIAVTFVRGADGRGTELVMAPLSGAGQPPLRGRREP